MIPNLCSEVHTSPVDRPSVPAWFAEVVIIVQHLATKGLLDAFAQAGSVWCADASAITSLSICWLCCSVMPSVENEP